MGILNPGPTNFLGVVFQNVHGLIPFSDLGDDHPNLHESKICELQCFAYQNKPDIIVLNETWLKSSIHDNEILSPDLYKIFRLDRSMKTHPPDPPANNFDHSPANNFDHSPANKFDHSPANNFDHSPANNFDYSFASKQF
jgi:hypothetical protein